MASPTLSEEEDMSLLLKKFDCLEWKVNPDFSAKSQMFVLKNTKCFLKYCFEYCDGKKNPVLAVDSQSKSPLSFTAEFQITCQDNSVKCFEYISEGIFPYKIMSDFPKEDLRGTIYGMFHFRIIFSDGSNIEMIEDVNAKTEIEENTSDSDSELDETTHHKLKKVTCLEWDLTEGFEFSNGESPNFVFEDQECFFTLNRWETKYSIIPWNKPVYTLSVNSEKEFTRCFDVILQVLWIGSIGIRVNYFAKIVRGDIYTWDESELSENILSFNSFIRIFFSSDISIKLMESADAKPAPGEENASTSQQSTLSPSYLDSEIGLRGLSSDLGKLLLSDHFKPDVFIKCGKSTIPAHRNILGTRSEVFKDMLQTNMSECPVANLEISDIEDSVCKQFVEYLYTASLPDLSVELALRLHQAGLKYAVDSLRKQCSNYLKANLSTEEACQLLIGSDYDLQKLLLSYIMGNDEILNSAQWTKFCAKNPKFEDM